MKSRKPSASSPSSNDASGAHLPPELKTFIDDVVVPALVQRWQREQAQRGEEDAKKAS